MDWKECKITCDGKEIATINKSEDGFSVKCSKKCREMCGKFGCF